MAIEGKFKPKVTIEAVVTRADGTVEDLGVISETKDKKVLKQFKKFLERMNKNG